MYPLATDRAIFQDATRSPLKLQAPLHRLSDATPVPLQVVPKVNGQTRLTRGGVPTFEIPLSFPFSNFASRIRADSSRAGWLQWLSWTVAFWLHSAEVTIPG